MATKPRLAGGLAFADGRVSNLKIVPVCRAYLVENTVSTSLDCALSGVKRKLMHFGSVVTLPLHIGKGSMTDVDGWAMLEDWRARYAWLSP